MVFFLPSNSHQPNSTIPHPGDEREGGGEKEETKSGYFVSLLPGSHFPVAVSYKLCGLG